MYVRKYVTINEFPTLSISNKDIEIVTYVVKAGHHTSVGICAVYRLPNGNFDHAMTHLRDTMEALTQLSSGELLVIGDLNVDLFNNKCTQTKKLTALTKSRYLKQLITTPTRITNTLY